MTTFTSKDGKATEALSHPVEGNKASEVVFQVLNAGKKPEDVKLQWAPSYKGHFLARKGKNCCGAFKKKDVLVVNGIAKELEAKGVAGIYCPEPSKSYKGINVSEMKEGELKALARMIANVLGFSPASAPKKVKAKKIKKETVPEVA